MTGWSTTPDGGAASEAVPDTRDGQRYTGPIAGYKTNWSCAPLAFGAIDPADNRQATQTEELA